MNTPVCTGATLLCTCGQLPATLTVTQRAVRHTSTLPLATVADCLPLVNIGPFGSCAAPANPIPLPIKTCTVVPVGTWLVEEPSILIDGVPVLTHTATLLCANGGVISILSPPPVGVFYFLAGELP